MHHVRRNRAGWPLTPALLAVAGMAVAQEPAEATVEPAQNAVAKALVAAIREAEASLGSVKLQLTTRCQMPGGLQISTSGEIRVLRAKQPGARSRTYTQLEYAIGQEMKGRMATAQTDAGILIYEEDPAFGAVFVEVPPAVVVDLEWASTVLQRSDLPGMADPRAQSPLGSGVLEDLTKAFVFAQDERTEHGGDAGTWLVGTRKAGLDANDPELPLADRVELFARAQDHAVLVVRYFVGEQVVQEVLVQSVAIDPTFDAKSFRVDGHGVPVRDVQEHAPIWMQIQAVLEKAELECKAKDPVQRARPSRRRELAEELRREGAKAGGTAGAPPDNRGGKD